MWQSILFPWSYFPWILEIIIYWLNHQLCAVFRYIYNYIYNIYTRVIIFTKFFFGFSELLLLLLLFLFAIVQYFLYIGDKKKGKLFSYFFSSIFFCLLQHNFCMCFVCTYMCGLYCRNIIYFMIKYERAVHMDQLLYYLIFSFFFYWFHSNFSFWYTYYDGTRTYYFVIVILTIYF